MSEDSVNYEVKPIGVVHCEFKDKSTTPKNGRREKAPAAIEIFPEYKDCLLGIEKLKYICILAWFHLSERDVHIITFRHRPEDQRPPPRGVFNSRSPVRPNPIGLSVLDLEKVDGLNLHVKGIDCVDGTYILDIKSYDPCLDNPFN